MLRATLPHSISTDAQRAESLQCQMNDKEVTSEENDRVMRQCVSQLLYAIWIDSVTIQIQSEKCLWATIEK